MIAIAQNLLRQSWRRIAPALVVSVFYFGLLIYPLLRMLTLAFPSWQPSTVELLVIMVAPLVGRLAYELAPMPATRWLATASLTWLGGCFISCSLVLGWELVNMIMQLPPVASGRTLLGASAALFVGAFVNAQLIGVRKIRVPTRGLSKPQRIAQISDVHIGSRGSGLLKRVVRKVNAHQPDWVAITGDLIDFHNISKAELAALTQLQAPAYFVIGNHERYVDLENICARLEELGVVVLRNATNTIQGLQVVGIDDAESRNQVRSQLNRLPPAPDQFRVLLYHRPDGAEDAARWGAHLMLCGHTHHGQIVPFNWLVKRVFPRIRGAYQVGEMLLYVSPGTGTWGPTLRLGSRSEIGMIELQ